MNRTRLTLSLTAAALMASAPAALADTTVSLESGTFGTGLSGTYLYVTDSWSPFDEPMDVTVSRDGNELKVTDAVGKMHAKAPCYTQGSAARCPSAVAGARLEGSDKNDLITNLTDLRTAWDGDLGKDLLLGGPVMTR